MGRARRLVHDQAGVLPCCLAGALLALAEEITHHPDPAAKLSTKAAISIARRSVFIGYSTAAGSEGGRATRAVLRGREGPARGGELSRFIAMRSSRPGSAVGLTVKLLAAGTVVGRRQRRRGAGGSF